MRKIPILIGLLAALCTVGCNSEKKEKKEERTFQVTNPVLKDTSYTKEYVCQIHSIHHIELRALEKGYLQKIAVDEGEHVKKGQQMFKIMPNVYEAELLKAKAEGESARIEYQNTKLLVDSSVVSPNELAVAKAEYDRAKAEISLAQTHLGFTQINAPFDGIIDHLEVREGSLLDEGEILTKLSDNSSMWVYFNVPEAEYLDYMMNVDKNEHQKVNLLLANNQQFNEDGVVETIEGEFNNTTGNIAFRAVFPNPKGILRHGETGNILMNTKLDHALLIPQKTTFEVLDKRFVFVVDKEGVLHQKEIKVTAEIPHLFAVEGLTENDQVLLEGIRLVKDNEKVKVNKVAPTEVLANLEIYAE
ncbi:efflux RND transporter periplasmic adaptor subunit [Flavimarina sp. Hel_I_48]|uniref:efflux RND transporter periplasmic adaptor subunit n=1 Tax=Flavimarina sp. Hel_I_48 TaxID=1392488 RepID=UPI0004DFBB0F|nr:efflux RND transporter periplasmic adaptor subunit [Flavimarina sp. Hel_I_48]